MLILGVRSLSDCRRHDLETVGEGGTSRVVPWHAESLRLRAGATHFGFVHLGTMRLISSAGSFNLQSGMYFSVPDAGQIEGDGEGLIVSRAGYRGFFQIGGPIEETGRMRYIDGCTDSLLIAPVVKGDPCLNLLHIPPGTDQTPHTHPSERVGMIVRGQGICRTPAEDHSLTPGLVFVIPAGSLHSFHTREEPLTVIAWHPDSDFGPSDESHPMLNRTVVDGRPVNARGEP